MLLYKLKTQCQLFLAGQTGVEPATFGFGDRCSTNWATALSGHNLLHKKWITSFLCVMYVFDPIYSIYVVPYVLFLISYFWKPYNFVFLHHCWCSHTQHILDELCLSWFLYLKTKIIYLEPESRIELPTSSLPRKRSTTELPRLKTHAVKARQALVGREGFEPSKAKPSDLQSDPVDHLGISPCWSWQ